MNDPFLGGLEAQPSSLACAGGSALKCRQIVTARSAGLEPGVGPAAIVCVQRFTALGTLAME